MIKSGDGNLRICVSCRSKAPQQELIRLTADHTTGAVRLNEPTDRACHGRSAYLCRRTDCAKQALKGTRLKVAIEGRFKKNKQTKRSIRWPLEPQLIYEIERLCTEPAKRCENTHEKGG